MQNNNDQFHIILTLRFISVKFNSSEFMNSVGQLSQ
jgi:hypothetical protein